MTVSFILNPFALLIECAEELWPGITVEVQFVPAEALDGNVGCTTFPDGGGVPLIDVSVEIPVSAAVEVLAHELAHVATDGEDHGPAWEAAFAAIHQLFERKAGA